MIKSEARKACYIARNQINNCRARSNRIIKKIVDSKLLDGLSCIGIYYPIKNEPNILSLTTKYPNITFCLPKTGDEIAFYCFTDNLVAGRFGTIEPGNDLLIERDKIEAFIIPSVGINHELRRLGYGKGYYDRYLAGYKGLKIGVQYHELVDLDFEASDYDVQFDYIFEE